MSVLLLKKKMAWKILNLHEFVYTPGAIDPLLLCTDELENQDDIDDGNSKHTDDEDAHLHEISNSQLLNNEKSTAARGQPSLAASETGSSSGVSIAQICEHLLNNIPGLKEHGISLSTTRRLFYVPNKGNLASR